MALLRSLLCCVPQGLQVIHYVLEVSNSISFYGQIEKWGEKYKQTDVNVIVTFVLFVLFIYLMSRI